MGFLKFTFPHWDLDFKCLRALESGGCPAVTATPSALTLRDCGLFLPVFSPCSTWGAPGQFSFASPAVFNQRRRWYPTPVLLPGKSHGRRNLVGCKASRRVGHDWATSLSLFTLMYWRRKWQPTPVFLPGESQGWGSLVGCCLWGRTESDMTEVISSSSSSSVNYKENNFTIKISRKIIYSLA